MLGKFSAQHSFHQPNLEFLHQALVAEQILYMAVQRTLQAARPCQLQNLEIVIVVMLSF